MKKDKKVFEKNEDSDQILFSRFLSRSTDPSSGLGFEDRWRPDLLQVDRQDWGPGPETALPEAAGSSGGKIG